MLQQPFNSLAYVNLYLMENNEARFKTMRYGIHIRPSFYLALQCARRTCSIRDSWRLKGITQGSKCEMREYPNGLKLSQKCYKIPHWIVEVRRAVRCYIHTTHLFACSTKYQRNSSATRQKWRTTSNTSMAQVLVKVCRK